MFGKKKNIGEQITEAYQKAHAEKDLGRRLLALDALKDKVDGLLKKPKNKRTPTLRVIPIALGFGCAGGAIVGGMISPALTEIVIAGTAGLIPGMIGGAIYDLAINDKRASKILSSQILKQTKEVFPHEAVLKQVLKQIAEDQSNIVRIENAEALKASSKFDMLIKKRPALSDFFRQANKVPEIPRIPGQQQKTGRKNTLSL